MAYALNQASDPSEPERLALIQRMYDPKTIPQLERLGVTTGWHCQDIGAGAGSISQWLAERVGPTGSVLALDLDLTLLQPLVSPVLSVRRHDIRSEELPKNADLVHARLVLEHLPDPESVLQRMVRALRLGGWLCVTDTDFLAVRLSESEPAFDSVISAFSRVAGWEMQLGPKLPAMMENAGLTSVGAEAWQRYERAGVSTLPLAMTYRRFRDKLIDLGVKATDIDLLVEKMTAGAIGVFSPTSWMAWGQKPDR